MSRNYAFAPYSPSRMETVMCPEGFRARYILKKKVPDANRGPLDKGSAIHRLFERIMNARIAGEAFTINDLDRMIPDVLAGRPLSPGQPAEDPLPAAFEFMHDVIRPACINLMTMPEHKIPHYDAIEECEKVFAINEDGLECSYDDENCFARSIIDLYARVGDHATLIDHKSQLNVEKSDTRKMLFYAWLAARSDRSLGRVSMILHFCHPDLNFFQRAVTLFRHELLTSVIVIDKNEKKRLQEFTTERFAEDIKKNNGEPTRDAWGFLRNLIKERGRVVDIPFNWITAKANWSEPDLRKAGLIADNEEVLARDQDDPEPIETQIMNEIFYIEAFRGTEGTWPAVPNSKCSYCPSYFDCPARVQADQVLAKAGVVRPKTLPEAQELMRTMLVYDDKVDILKKELKAFITDDNTKVPSVAYGDQEFATRMYPSMEFDKNQAELKVLLRDKLKVNPDDYMKFDSKLMNKLVATVEDPKLIAEIRALVPEKWSSRTQVYKL